MLEGHEGEILKPIVGFQVIEETAEPGSATLGVTPDLNVFGDAFENRASEFVIRVDAVESRGELQVQGPIVLGLHVLAVGLFAQLNVRDGIAALLDVGHLRGGIFGRAVQHRNGNDGGQAAGDSAGEEEVPAGLVAGFHAVGGDIDVGGLVPGVDGGTERQSLILIWGVVEDIGESVLHGGGAEIEFADGVADTIATIGGAMRVAGVGGAGHQDTHEFRADWRRTHAAREEPTFRVGYGSVRESFP